MSLLVVGSVAFDSIETAAGKRDEILGGAASYFATAASFLARPVQLVAVVGDDFPASHVETLSQRGIDLAGLQRTKGKTFRWRGRYSKDFTTRTTLDTQLGVFETFLPSLPDAYREADYVFLANIHPALQLEVLSQVKRRPKLVACDTMNYWIERTPNELKKTLAKVDLLVINDEEARQLAGEHHLVRAARAILSLGPKTVIIKRGDSGAFLFHDDGIFAAPAFPVEEVIDPTGAGDSFAGGFMGYLACKDSLDSQEIRRAMIYGSTLASFAVEDFSLDRLLRLKNSEIAARFQAFKQLTHFEELTL